MGLFWVAPAAALFVGYLALPSHVTANHCGAALFGCTVTPKDATVLLAMYVYPLVVIAGVLIMGIIAVGQAWHHWAWDRRGVTGRGAVVALPALLAPTCLLAVAPPVVPAPLGSAA